MSLAKLPFLLSGLITTYTVQTPPQARVPASKRGRDLGFLERFVSSTALFNAKVIQAFTSTPLLIEAAIILANRFPSHELSRWILRVLASNDPGFVRRIALSPAFITACIIGTAGGALRYQCYRTLGRFFTLELAIRDGHKLVTEGPYRFVRHPSYTAWIVGTFGVGAMSVMCGSWFRESGLLETRGGRVALVAGTLWAVYGVVGLTMRTPTEDRMMKKQFGEEWEAYAKRVPYRMLPYVF